MADNYIQPGATLGFIAPSGGVTNGVGKLVQGVVVIPTSDAVQGAPFQGHIEGVWMMAKASGATWTTGQALYWDTANNNWVTAKSATARRAGIAAAPAGTSDTTGAVKLANVGNIANVD